MVESNSSKFSPAKYDINSEMIVRRCTSKTRKRSIVNKQARIVRGRVIKRNFKSGTYKIRYNVSNCPVEQWFKVSDITSLTLEEENRKHINTGEKQLEDSQHNKLTSTFEKKAKHSSTNTGNDKVKPTKMNTVSSSEIASTCTKGMLMCMIKITSCIPLQTFYTLHR